ncbi:MAG: hypothetical protein K5639_05545 [Eubacterium sp.]|nr:hypothetical protein [Eubacterium sp.]
MLPAEIILIIIGFGCISFSFFVAGKNNKKEEGDGVRGEDIWTKKDEEVIIKHVDEILSERGLELVDTTEDRMNTICNDKIMAIDEFSKPILDKIKVNHDEVVFMYNMLIEKKKELQKESMAETLEKSVPVINKVKDDEARQATVFVTPDKDVVTGLKRAKKSTESQIVKKDEKKPAPKKRVFTTEKNSGKSALETLSKNPGELPSQLYERIQKPEPVPVPVKKKEARPEPVKAEHIKTESVRESFHARDEEPADMMRRPSRESVMKSISETSANRSSEDVEESIRQMYKQGKSVMDISKELNIGQGEVKLMIALLKKRS